MFRNLFGVLLALGLGAAWAAPARAEKPLKVVATLSTFSDLVKTIGGDRVEASHVASPRFNPHFIEPRPSDVLKVKKADLFIHAGLDLELWRWPLVDAAGNPAVRPGGERELDLSRGVSLLGVPIGSVSRAEGDIHLYGNPHYWAGPQNGPILARSIAGKLSQIDPAHAADYQRRLDDFLKELEQARQRWARAAAGGRGMEVICYHDAWPYLEAFLGLKTELFLEPKPGIPPTPQQILRAEGRIREQGVRAILQAGYDPPAAAEALRRKTGVRVVTLCQNVGEKPECGDYLGMMDHNVREILSALEGRSPDE